MYWRWKELILCGDNKAIGLNIMPRTYILLTFTNGINTVFNTIGLIPTFPINCVQLFAKPRNKGNYGEHEKLVTEITVPSNNFTNCIHYAYIFEHYVLNSHFLQKFNGILIPCITEPGYICLTTVTLSLIVSEDFRSLTSTQL